MKKILIDLGKGVVVTSVSMVAVLIGMNTIGRVVNKRKAKSKKKHNKKRK